MKYEVGMYIYHSGRGSTYQIEATPENFKVRDGDEWYPGYLYRSIVTGEKFARRQDVIEGPKYTHAEGVVSPLTVVCAANRFLSDGLIIPSARHYDNLMHAIIKALGRQQEEMEQGFIDRARNFLTRESAYERVRKLGQRRYRCGGDSSTLYSENLY